MTGARPFTCDANASEPAAKIPASSESFRSLLGVDWDAPAFPVPGDMDQLMYVYQSPSAAQRAWAQLGRSLVKCRKNARTPIPANQEFERTVTGVLPFGFGEIPGLWSRELSISDSGFSRTTYSTFLLVGSTIQKLTYTRAMKGMKQVPLDQGAVNVLSATLAKRWAESP